MRVVFAVLLLFPLAACELVYKLPTRQGNVIEQKDLDKLALGMTREQVRFLLGTPIASGALREDRWDYYGYYKPPRGVPYSRTVSLYFAGDQLVRMEGEKPKAGGDTPAVQAVETGKGTLKEEPEPEKKDSILTPPDQQGHPGGGAG